MGLVQDQGRVPTPTEGLLPGQKLVQKLVQTKFTLQELSFSGKHDLSARTLVPGLVEGRPIAPLFPADLTPRCGEVLLVFSLPPGASWRWRKNGHLRHRHHHSPPFNFTMFDV